MAHSAISQSSLIVPLNDCSARRSLFKTCSISFHDKSWRSVLPMDLKTKKAQSRSQSIICMSVQQASKPKVAVSPLALEDAEVPPLNLHKPKEPYTATIVSVERLVGLKAPGETCHIVIDHGGNIPYWEGQSYGVIPPGLLRTFVFIQLLPQGMGTLLMVILPVCVLDGLFIMIPRQEKKISKNGVCSNFLCDSKPGDEVKITGPSGKIMLLPEDDPNATHIMIATGTGVAPFRGYLRRMFMESVPKFKFIGLAWLFLGMANTDSLLYEDKFTTYLQDYPDNFWFDLCS